MSKSYDNFNIADLLSSNENDAAKLAVIAGIITTLGDGLSNYGIRGSTTIKYQ